MSQRVLFNGAVLVRPGAATKIEASQFQNIVLTGVGTVGLIGEADDGEPRTVQIFTDAADVKAFYRSGDLVEAAAMAADPGNDTRISGGAQSLVCYKVNNSTKATRAHASTFVYSTRRYGLGANSVTIGVAAGTGSTRIATIGDFDEFGAAITEVSPELGGTGKFSIQYTGASTTCAMTITATALTTTTGGPSTPADDLNILFADYANLQDIINFINAHASYTCAALVTNAAAFDPSYLDAVVALDVKTALATVYARNFDLYEWINLNSSIVTAAITKGQTGPTAVLVAGPFTGGTRGTGDNTAWTNGLIALRNVRINQLVLLASKDGTVSQGSFTILSLAAALVAHCKYVSSTAGRNECQGWLGLEGTLTAAVAAANLHNSEHLCLVAQKPKRARTFDGAITTFGEWGYAVMLAGMRAGAPLGEPLTWKYVNVLGQTCDSSWSPDSNDNVVTLTLNGVIVVCAIRGRGFRIDKGITTFTRFDNDAYIEETVVQIWKAIAYELRATLEDVYVGRPGTLPVVSTAPATIKRVCELFKDAGAITDSDDGPAYRNIKVRLSGNQMYAGVTITPTPGINFVLTTITLVPATISA